MWQRHLVAGQSVDTAGFRVMSLGRKEPVLGFFDNAPWEFVVGNNAADASLFVLASRQSRAIRK